MRGSPSRSTFSAVPGASRSTTSSASSKAGARATTSPLGRDHDAVPVEDELVLAADRVHERDPAAVVAGALGEHLLALQALAEVERRGRQVRHEAGAGRGQLARGRAFEPDVLADRRREHLVADPEQEAVDPALEVALLVEDTVVRQVLLAVDRLHLAVRADRARVVERPGRVRRADERHDPRHLGGDRGEALVGRAQERRAQQQILRRIAGRRELGEEDEVGACVPRFGEPVRGSARGCRRVADDRVDLRQRDPHAWRITRLSPVGEN